MNDATPALSVRGLSKSFGALAVAQAIDLDLEPGARCTVDLDGLHAAGAITNHTTKAWDYIVKVVWEDSGATLAESTTVLRGVAPGARAPFESTSAEKTGTAATTCRVRGIDRLKPDR